MTNITMAFKPILAVLIFLIIPSFAYLQERGANDNFNYDIEKRIESLDLVLPNVSAPVANYQNAVVTGNLVFLSGKGPRSDKGEILKGKLGSDTSIEEAYQAARRVGVMQLATLKEAIGDLNRVKKIVKVTGMVNATDDFTQHPEVINGFSDLMEEVFGERGKHARAAVGMSSLPRGMICEIEMIVEID